MKIRFLGTAIVSMPFDDPDNVRKISLNTIPDAPTCPQLPEFGVNEHM